MRFTPPNAKNNAVDILKPFKRLHMMITSQHLERKGFEGCVSEYLILNKQKVS